MRHLTTPHSTTQVVLFDYATPGCGIVKVDYLRPGCGIVKFDYIRIIIDYATITVDYLKIFSPCAFLPYLIDPWTGAVAFSTIVRPSFAPDGHMHAARATPR